MKKVINGKSYDTEKARLLNSFDTSDRSSFSWYREELYIKRTGEYFLFGKGHAASPYGRAVTRTERAPGEDIRPLTMEEARQWAEKHLTADEYEGIFGEIADDDSRTVLSITLPASLAERIRREASAAGVSLSAYIEGRLS